MASGNKFEEMPWPADPNQMETLTKDVNGTRLSVSRGLFDQYSL